MVCAWENVADGFSWPTSCIACRVKAWTLNFPPLINPNKQAPPFKLNLKEKPDQSPCTIKWSIHNLFVPTENLMFLLGKKIVKVAEVLVFPFISKLSIRILSLDFTTLCVTMAIHWTLLITMPDSSGRVWQHTRVCWLLLNRWGNQRDSRNNNNNNKTISQRNDYLHISNPQHRFELETQFHQPPVDTFFYPYVIKWNKSCSKLSLHQIPKKTKLYF